AAHVLVTERVDPDLQVSVVVGQSIMALSHFGEQGFIRLPADIGQHQVRERLFLGDNHTNSHSCAPCAPSSRTPYRTVPTRVSSLGLLPGLPGRTSRISLVPAAVPLLFQGSAPCVPSAAAK